LFFILGFGKIGLNVLVSEIKYILDEKFHSNIDVDGVRKHLWRVAYPEKLYFVGELTGMTAFSPKMVRKIHRKTKSIFISI